jgi:hypothetical protein
MTCSCGPNTLITDHWVISLVLTVIVLVPLVVKWWLLSKEPKPGEMPTSVQLWRARDRKRATDWSAGGSDGGGGCC